MSFQDILEELLESTAASRTTLRLDLPAGGFHVDRVAAEAVAPGVRSIGEDASIDQRALPTVRFLEEERHALVQNDCSTADPPPPPELIESYGVRAQMLGPVVRDDDLTGWISVHYTPGPREWSEENIGALQQAVEHVQRKLGFTEDAGRGRSGAG